MSSGQDYHQMWSILRRYDHVGRVTANFVVKTMLQSCMDRCSFPAQKSLHEEFECTTNAREEALCLAADEGCVHGHNSINGAFLNVLAYVRLQNFKHLL